MITKITGSNLENRPYCIFRGAIFLSSCLKSFVSLINMSFIISWILCLLVHYADFVLWNDINYLCAIRFWKDFLSCPRIESVLIAKASKYAKVLYFTI